MLFAWERSLFHVVMFLSFYLFHRSEKSMHSISASLHLHDCILVFNGQNFKLFCCLLELLLSVAIFCFLFVAF